MGLQFKGQSKGTTQKGNQVQLMKLLLAGRSICPSLCLSMLKPKLKGGSDGSKMQGDNMSFFSECAVNASKMHQM